MAPLTPVLAQHLWETVTRTSGVMIWQEWPVAEPIQRNWVTLVIQVNGKTRGTMVVDSQQLDQASQLAKEGEIGQKWLQGKRIRQVIHANQGKIINFVLAS